LQIRSADLGLLRTHWHDETNRHICATFYFESAPQNEYERLDTIKMTSYTYAVLLDSTQYR